MRYLILTLLLSFSFSECENPNQTEYLIDCGGGSFQQEMSWNLLPTDINGGAPYTEYICLYDGQYELRMLDSWGDGWNGNIWSLYKGDFIPEQHSDYIFATIGEEWGFIGSVLTILIFSLLLLRIIQRTSTQRNLFYKIYSYCVVTLLFFHFSINISMVIGIFPSVGIPLPFISYGGSSMLAFTILFAGYIKIDSNKKERW